MEFTWNPAKAVANLRKHGIDFGGATKIFDDPSAIVTVDPRDYAGELRYRVIGEVEGRILCVAFTIRNERYRIISARRASRRDRTTYSV